jgi:hypothetical protein
MVLEFCFMEGKESFAVCLRMPFICVITSASTVVNGREIQYDGLDRLSKQTGVICFNVLLQTLRFRN